MGFKCAVKSTKKDRLAFGSAIARRRNALCITQSELARRCGISTNLVNNFERGENWPSLPTYKVLVRVLWDGKNPAPLLG